MQAIEPFMPLANSGAPVGHSCGDRKNLDLPVHSVFLRLLQATIVNIKQSGHETWLLVLLFSGWC
jgi:hypothetical protein